MTGDPLRPLQPGDPLPSSVRTWNPLLALARDRKTPLPGAGDNATGVVQILVRNDSGSALGKCSPVTLNGSAVLAADNLQQFQERSILLAEAPNDDRLARLAITTEPIADGELGRAVVSGAVVVPVDLASGDTHATPIDSDATKLQGGTSGHLILYRPGDNGVQWCVVLLGSHVSSSGIVFPVTLAQTGGSDGTTSTSASWTYTVTDAITGATLGTGVNPSSSPHKFKRPSVGKMHVADFGHAHFDGAELVIGWINEYINATAC